MNKPHSEHPQIELTRIAAYDQICDRFEAAWRTGGQPQLEDALGAEPEPGRSVLLRELLAVELEQRNQRGEHPSPAEYLARFPACQSWLDELWRKNANPAAPVDENRAELPTQHDLDIEITSSMAPHAESPTARPEAIGRYRLLECLGEGGMGTVYHGRHTMIDREVAIKVLRADLARSALAGQRFLREAQACVKLVHPNIVTTHDVDRIGELVFMTMELLDGLNLAQYVNKRGPLPPPEAARIIQQSAQALSYAHSQGIIHRDIKPHNIMVLADGRVKLLDMGLARILDDDFDAAQREADADPNSPSRPFESVALRCTTPGSLLGTLAYMPPEQARDARQADARSDIYSLGCTLYFLLSGEHAFTGEKPEVVVAKHARAEYRRLAELNPQIPAELAAIVEQMIALEPSERYSTATEVVNALSDWLQSLPGGKASASKSSSNLIRDVGSLKRTLLDLELVSNDDWDRAVSAASAFTRSSRTEGPTWTSMITENPYVPPDRGVTPMSVLRRLQMPSAGKTEISLTDFQMQLIVGGQPELLRLPNHVLLERIGQSWKGEIFKARNIRQNRIEALRTFSPASLVGLEGSDSERLDAFLAHCRKLASLDHPALAKVYESGRFHSRAHGELAYVATEFVNEQNLQALLASPATIPDRTKWAADCIRELALALESAAAQGVHHWNLSPLCIKGGSSGAIKLLDIGIAELVLPRPGENDNAQSLFQKNPSFQPHATGHSPDQIDLYGLGTTFLYLLAGEQAFPEARPGSPLFPSVPRQDWSNTSNIRHLPSPIRNLLKGLLATHPVYTSFAQVIRELDSIQASRSQRRILLKTLLLLAAGAILAGAAWKFGLSWLAR